MAARKQKKQKAKSTGKPAGFGRFYLIAVLLSAGATAVMFSMAKNQVASGEEGKEFLQAQGKARSLRKEDMVALRGMITDRYGEALAVSTPVTTIWANPRILKTEERSLNDLADALDIPVKKLQKKSDSNRYFVYLKRHMSPGEAQRVIELDYDGVYAKREYRRFYPAAEVAAHVVGFTNIDEQGQEGMELAYNDVLQGVNGQKRVLKDLSGRVIKDVQLIKTPQAGENLRLSLDLRVQYLAYTELKKAVINNSAKSGSVVVLDRLSGEVLAMANHPSYNPNNRHGLSGSELRNRAVTDVFEPGSTVKPLAMIAALESGKYQPHTKVDTSPGYFTVASKTYKDKRNLGLLDVSEVIAKSSQVGIIKMAMTLEGNDIRNALYRVGFGQPTGSAFPGESVGVFPNMQMNWRPVEQAAMAFGHGLSVTPLQLARAYMVLANQGVKRKVSLLHQNSFDRHGDLVEDAFSESVLTADVSNQIVGMMRTVTQSGGTATRANVAAYTVAGKTGTSHKAIAGGYSEDRYTAVFAGIAPASAPRFVTVVMIDEPSAGKHYGGQVAAPVFSEVMAAALRLYGVPPDNLSSASLDKKKPSPIRKKRLS